MLLNISKFKLEMGFTFITSYNRFSMEREDGQLCSHICLKKIIKINKRGRKRKSGIILLIKNKNKILKIA